MPDRQKQTRDANPDLPADHATQAYYSNDARDIGWLRENVPCQTACPAGTDIPAYIWAILEEKYGLSYEINREANVLPGILGRICSRPCEDVCRHGWPGNGEPVNICHLKRSASDREPLCTLRQAGCRRRRGPGGCRGGTRPVAARP
jgi:formate dehydrogenase major subunit